MDVEKQPADRSPMSLYETDVTSDLRGPLNVGGGGGGGKLLTTTSPYL